MQTSSDPRKGEFTPTSIEEYMACRRKYFFKKVLKLLPKSGKLSANYGTCIHAGIGAFYGNQNLSLEERKILAAQAFTKEWESLGLLGDGKRTLAGGLLTIERYCEAYAKDRFVFHPKLIEVSQTVEMPNKTILIVRIDRVSVTDGSAVVYDTKTSSMSFTDFWFRQYENSFQLTAYYYVVASILQQTVDCIIVDAIKVPYSTGVSRTTKEPIENFVRRSYLRTDLQMAEFLNSYSHITEEILEALSHGDSPEAFPQCPTACSNYGGCEYHPVCKHGFSHPSTSLDFEVKQ